MSNTGTETPGRSPFQVPTPSFMPTTSLPAISGCTSPPISGRLPAPPVQQVERIIPDEDPQRPVDLGDDDDDDEGDGEGVGSEDLDETEGDEGDDEGDPSQVPAGPSERPQTRRRLPEWLLSQFRMKLAECGPNFRDVHGLPPLYASGNTFWFPQPSTFFLLKHDNPSPDKLYNPRFFLWDPEPLCCGGIPCPNCRHRLHRHGHISRPRRIVDVNSTFWMIGYRYRCPTCVHPKTGKRTVTYHSWDSRILAVLPAELSSEFPARLSHRSGISNVLFSWVRSCFAKGMGGKQVSDAIREQHLLHYDFTRLQYFNVLCSRTLDGWIGKKYDDFPPFEDTSPNGPRNFLPCAQWLWDMYSQFMEGHRNSINQHTAMRSASIIAIDHSHKVCNESWSVIQTFKIGFPSVGY